MTAPILPSSISAVTVYRRGARVTRVCELPPDAPRELRLVGLPATLEDGSVQVRVTAGSDVEAPTASDFHVALASEAGAQSTKRVKDEELEAQRLVVAGLRAEAAAVEEEHRLYSEADLITLPPDEHHPTNALAPLAARRRIAELFAGQDEAASAALETLRLSLAEAEDRLAALEDRQRRTSSDRELEPDELRKALTVSLTAGGGPARLSVSYLIPGARWVPSYRFELDAAAGRATVRMRAQLAQLSGEDWTDVALTLATAHPDRWTERLELASLRIGRAQPMKPSGWRPAPGDTGSLYDDLAKAFPLTGRGAVTGAVAPRPPPPPAPSPNMGGDDEAWVTQDMPAMPGMAREAKMLMARSGAMPAAAPAPQSYAAPKSRGLQRSRRRTAAITNAPFESAPDERTQALSLGASAFAGGHLPHAPQVEQPLVAARSQLDYGTLRIAGPYDERRGQLVPETADVRAAHQQRRAWQLAQAVFTAPLPRGLREAWPDDYDYAYSADAPVSVPSDGQLHGVAVTAAAGDASFAYVVVPRESRDVYREARIANPLAGPLLPGPVDVYMGREFLLASSVAFTPPRGEVSLGLGVESAIKVARNSTFTEETSGLLGGSMKLRHHVTVDVVNHLAQAVNVEVRERLPVTREDEDDIDVLVDEVSPAWEAYEPFPERAPDDRLRGGHRWRTELAGGGAERRLELRYTVKIASKNELVGGNRREP